MIEQLETWDRALFLFLNGQHNETFDVLMKWITYKYTWIPLYGLMLILMGRKYGWKRTAVLIVPSIAILILLTDQISYNGFKQQFERLRPCHNFEIGHLVHLVSGCGGKYGFLSGHATTSFAIAIFGGSMLDNKNWKWGLLVWAALVAYSRIYVGVHYPSDIFCGAILGIILAFFTIRMMRLVTKRLSWADFWLD